MSASNTTNEPGNRGGVIRKYPEDTPMEIEEEHASKRMRLTYQRGADLNVYNKPAQAKVHLEPDWSLLPYTVLKHIYTVLPNTHRYSMSLTCRSWNAPFRTPDLWRNLTFRFNRVQDKKAKRFCQTMVPTGVRHLNIDCK
uniref:F-box domain-containing protein n=1 Tax=Biomphalaria glabrata TaxID=6526 RepID=A0A2C9LL43_BIOGL